jgi:hypothetical protein
VRLAGGEPALLPAYRVGDDPAEPSDDIETWDLWPWSLLGTIPAAYRAAFDGTPATVIWHFQLADGSS